MPATHNKSVATEESLRFTLRDLAAPILRRKRTVTFLFVASVTLLLGYPRLQKNPAHRTVLAPAALTDAKGASNASQSLNEADLEREAKLDEQMYLLYLSSREQERAEDTVPTIAPRMPAQSTTVIVLIAVVLGLFISLSLAYLVDYCDPCFHSPVQVIRTLRIPLVVAIPKRTS
jgi:hypothetical protein